MNRTAGGDAVRTLELVVEKADKLERSRFAQTLASDPTVGVHGTVRSEGAEVGWRGPDEDAVDAFVLTLRFFIQNNEPTSFANLENLFTSLSIGTDRVDAFVESRRVINSFLDQPTFISLGSQKLTKRYVFEVFLWGGLAHANREKKAVFDSWVERVDVFPFLRLDFTSTLIELLAFIYWIRQAAREALEILRSDYGAADA